MIKTKRLLHVSRFVLSFALLLCFYSPLSAGDPHSAQYLPDTDKLLWFIHASDTHIGTRGSTDSTNLQWLVGEAKDFINPSFIVVSGDLTDSTNGNWLGYPNGPYQAEWTAYKAIVDPKVNSTFYFDLPGNHDAYNDRDFNYYRLNSVQGRATGKTQLSWIREGAWGKYHFLGVNTADNTGAPFSLSWPYGDYPGLDDSELDFIGQQLAANGGTSLTLIFGHHPLAPTGNNSDTYLYYGTAEFVGLMDYYGTSLYGYGHTHVSSEKFFIQEPYEGIFYFNVSALGKDSPNQFTVTAIDCNGISSVTQNVKTWPVVLITAPMNRRLGGIVNPYAYTVTNGASNPIRALVFDRLGVTKVEFRVNGGNWQPMTGVSEKPHLWQGIWNASTLPSGEYTLEVQATTGSGIRTDSVITTLDSTVVLPTIGAVNVTTSTSSYKQGETVVVYTTVMGAGGNPVAGATVNIEISGPSSVNLISGPSSGGIAEARWTTLKPNKRGKGGTPLGAYRATVRKVTASGYVWDGLESSTTFTMTKP